MKTIISLFRPFFLILFLFAISFGQNDLKQNEMPSLKEADIKFDIALKEKKVKIGKAVELNTLIENNSPKNVSTLPFYLDDSLGFYVIEVFNSEGKILKRKDVANVPRGGSRTALDFMSSEKFSSKLKLNDFYDLPVGKYIITASFIALYPEKRERFFIESNRVTLIVIK